jgi:menaquinone-9 beta-reductase
MYDVIIIGGGLAGLVSSIELARQNLKVLLIEKYTYPFNRVCGEYISNEVRPYLESLGLDLNSLGVSNINKLQISSPKGNLFETNLQLGGFGISRYLLDYQLFKLSESYGTGFLLGTIVENVEKINDKYFVEIQNGNTFEAKVIIGAFGKRSILDKQLKRRFLLRKSPYMGVKYHIKFDFPKNKIALHNFKDGYCGISAIEDDKYCLCYLSSRENFKNRPALAQVEEEILYKNPYLKRIFNEADFLLKKPEVINEISFETKSLIEQGILMVGDTGGMIAPLCGNGMAMAIRGAKMLNTLIIKYLSNEISRNQLEKTYETEWAKAFSKRLYFGRKIQNMFGDETLTEIAVSTIKNLTFLHKPIIRLTHGKVLEV